MLLTRESTDLFFAFLILWNQLKHQIPSFLYPLRYCYHLITIHRCYSDKVPLLPSYDSSLFLLFGLFISSCAFLRWIFASSTQVKSFEWNLLPFYNPCFCYRALTYCFELWRFLAQKYRKLRTCRVHRGISEIFLEFSSFLSFHFADRLLFFDYYLRLLTATQF